MSEEGSQDSLFAEVFRDDQRLLDDLQTHRYSPKYVPHFLVSKRNIVLVLCEWHFMEKTKLAYSKIKPQCDMSARLMLIHS